MPHGDFSDMAALGSFVVGTTSIVAPSLYFSSVGPLKPMFDLPAEGAPDAQMLALIRFLGGMFLCLAPIFFVVRWNVLNGKAAALGCIFVAASAVGLALSLDSFAFVLRGWYFLAAFYSFSGLHFAMFANPMLTSAMLAEKEKKKVEKAAAKAQ
uniref:Uncharacterized protein n=1 Tax=Prymnesium polylepis TaxID=72548 RepID=A0A6V4GB07_9EUKA|mmetsp:Transcript_28363/g.69898  ORF Transcript_28363/g.69898 Transcript_28363/m.69898 type:complete len:154 (+) Transcript_28363:45-506(+)